MTPNVKKVLQEYTQNNHNYDSIVLEKKQDFFTIKLL